ncbi:MAG: FKBP-type peptidyl-prolyl cis-trans isomerase [Chthoniobacterales bacterium]|jgi:FKBP-type peptidyl-prolyl cis-trans isomerase FkpA|nr:FKBP-type peptidyl-prolyl cis-trans isomerase [Chthoniobacterales bacterium]
MNRSFKFLTVALTVAISLILNPTHLMSQSNNLEVGQAFLKENASKPGVHTTPSGLQYKVVTEGHGKSPKATDTVLVHYRGTTIDGTEFDSSYKRNEPISFPLNGVIPGWTEGVQLMKEGGKIELFIPSNLAYGSRGAGGVIAPDSTLIFDIELLKVQ